MSSRIVTVDLARLDDQSAALNEVCKDLREGHPLHGLNNLVGHLVRALGDGVSVRVEEFDGYKFGNGQQGTPAN